MKACEKLFAAFCATLYLSALPIFGQSSFQNLNFETENIPQGTQPGTVVTIPGWTTSPQVYYDSASIGGALVTINDSQTPYINFAPLQGSFSVILWAGPDGPNGASFITQTGMVPANAQSILMDIAFPFGDVASMPFSVTLGGQQITMSPVQTLANYTVTVYGGSILSADAGQAEALTITQFAPAPPTVPPSSMVLDNIVFSPNSIPEPATWTLLLCGAGLLAVTRHRRKP